MKKNEILDIVGYVFLTYLIVNVMFNFYYGGMVPYTTSYMWGYIIYTIFSCIASHQIYKSLVNGDIDVPLGAMLSAEQIDMINENLRKIRKQKFSYRYLIKSFMFVVLIVGCLLNGFLFTAIGWACCVILYSHITAMKINSTHEFSYHK